MMGENLSKQKFKRF